MSQKQSNTFPIMFKNMFDDRLLFSQFYDEPNYDSPTIGAGHVVESRKNPKNGSIRTIRSVRITRTLNGKENRNKNAKSRNNINMRRTKSGSGNMSSGVGTSRNASRRSICKEIHPPICRPLLATARAKWKSSTWNSSRKWRSLMRSSVIWDFVPKVWPPCGRPSSELSLTAWRRPDPGISLPTI